VGVALFYVSYFRAVRAGGAAVAAILLYTAPAWVALGSWTWLGERITRRTLAALALTLGGVALVSAGSGAAAGPAAPLGGAALGWGLLAGLAYASYYLFGKRYFARYDPPTIYMYALLLARWRSRRR
jgi:DME family drug/metabolite transporter